MQKRSRNMAIGTAIAAGIGYAAGVLTAPKSGRETRKDLQKAAAKAKREAEARLKSLHGELTDLIGSAKAKASKLKTDSKDGLNDALTRAQKAKAKAGEILSAIHEGEAEDKDLDKAVKEIKDAVDTLKSYVKKAS